MCPTQGWIRDLKGKKGDAGSETQIRRRATVAGSGMKEGTGGTHQTKADSGVQAAVQLVSE